MPQTVRIIFLTQVELLKRKIKVNLGELQHDIHSDLKIHTVIFL